MDLTPRSYQLAIYNSIKEHGNTLVVLPTGLGKTLIALMLIRDHIEIGRSLFLTPTKPLAKQHEESIRKILGINDISLVTGEIPAKKRSILYKSKVIVSTPQTINNDLESGILDPNFSLVIFDECHRAIGDYAYTHIASKIKNSTFVGLTASPGGKMDRIKMVMDALHISNVEIRTHEDPDVQKYVQKSTINWIKVDLSNHFKEIKIHLDNLSQKHARILSSMGFPPPLKHKGQFMQMRQRILNTNHSIKFAAMIQYSILLHVLHMSELLETQGIYPLRDYIEKLKEKKSKSANILLKDSELAKIKALSEKDEDHPKMLVLIKKIQELKNKKIIVFVQYRSQIARIEDVLNKMDIPAKRFVGKKEGMTRKIQEETIEEFRNGKFNVLIASCIGEEGLDIPAVDTVIFYEPVPSEIRSIQRRGRAARMQEGEVIVLMTKETRDEYYYHASKNKEKKMKSILSGMQKTKIEHKKKPIKIGQSKMSDFM